MSNVIQLGQVPVFSHLDDHTLLNFLWFAKFNQGMDKFEGKQETVSMRIWRQKVEQEIQKRKLDPTTGRVSQ